MPLTKIQTDTSTEKLAMLQRGCYYKIAGEEGIYQTRLIPADEFGPDLTVVYEWYTSLVEQSRGRIISWGKGDVMIAEGKVLNQIYTATTPLSKIEVLTSYDIQLWKATA